MAGDPIDSEFKDDKLEIVYVFGLDNRQANPGSSVMLFTLTDVDSIELAYWPVKERKNPRLERAMKWVT